jgi:hypothetical protein
MKLTDQNVPAGMAAVYASLISTNAALVAGKAIAKKRNGVGKLRRKRNENKLLKACYDAARALGRYLTAKDGGYYGERWITDEARRLYRREFNPDYWEQLAPVAEEFLTNTPTYTAFTGPRNYAYPDPYNQPTKAVYGDGTTTLGPPLYSGATSGGYFVDGSLCWLRQQMRLSKPIRAGDGEPLFLVINCNINAEANYRPSRAMISMILDWALTDDTAPEYTSSAAPVTRPVSQYWRYQQPRGEPPFFSLTKALQGFYDMRQKSREKQIGLIDALVVKLAPMPMMGKRYNNNTSVYTELTDIDLRVYAMRRTAYAVLTWYESQSWGILSDDNLTATLEAGAGLQEFRSTAYVSSGAHYWEVRINRCDIPAGVNVKIGICRKIDETDGHRDQQYITVQHHAKVYNYDGEEWESENIIEINESDVIGIGLDMDLGRWSLWVNGSPEGVMFNYMYDWGNYVQDPVTEEWLVRTVPISGSWAAFVLLYGEPPAEPPIIEADMGQQNLMAAPPAGYQMGIEQV